MKRYSVIILPEAEQDIEDAYLYISEDSPQNAMNWYRNICTKIQSLSSFPLRCPLAPENDFFQEEIRHLIINYYRILVYHLREYRLCASCQTWSPALVDAGINSFRSNAKNYASKSLLFNSCGKVVLSLVLFGAE